MIHSNSAAKRIGIVLAAVAGLFAVTSWLPAEPTPGKQDRLVAELVCAYLQRGHLSKPEIGDELSKQLFQRFFKELDPTKLYFLKEDIEEFKKYETQLDDMLLQGDLSYAYKVYERLVMRFGERMKLIEEMVNAKHDFTVKEYLPTDFDKIDFAANDAELRERWRKRIKFDLLLQKLGSKPVASKTNPGKVPKSDQPVKPLSEAEARQKVLARYKSLFKYWKQMDNYDLMERYLSALTTCVDPHSNYMSPTTLADFDIAMRLQLEGIGALLRSENGFTIVAEVIPGGAAAKDGRLKVNDKIIGVAQGDGKFVDTPDMKLTEVVKLIRGHRGTPVELKVLPAEKLEPVVYSYKRQKIELKAQEARAEIIEQGKKADGTPFRFGVIDLPSFYADMEAARSRRGGFKSATEDVRKILNDFNAKGVDGVVLDLRHNGGGALTEARSLTGLFIDEGPVVQVKGSQGKVQHLDDPEKGTVYSGPLVVLVSRMSASASEILAGALQDYGRALIVGDSATHGKGTVQMVVDLGNQVQAEEPPKLGALKLTVQQFYRVNGDSTQNRGVTSDIVLPSITEYLATGEKDLEHALAFDQVPPVDHPDLGQVPADLKAILKARSAQRVKESKDFTKLAQEIELIKARQARKSLPLNEQELRAQFAKDEADKIEDSANGILQPEPRQDSTTYKFQRNFTSTEILHVLEDLVRGKDLVRAAAAGNEKGRN
jgi:carboxyl-terminal processing protease